jgi:hypothetical protein
MLAGVPAWVAARGKTTLPSVVKAEQYVGTGICWFVAIMLIAAINSGGIAIAW